MQSYPRESYKVFFGLKPKTNRFSVADRWGLADSLACGWMRAEGATTTFFSSTTSTSAQPDPIGLAHFVRAA